MFVEDYLILARSVTYGQRMQKAMNRAGIRCQLFRAPRDLTDLGCAYVLQVSADDLARAVTAIDREALGPVQVFLRQFGTYREVRL